MTLDRHAAERQRFARLLGIHEELGSGLPIGSDSSIDHSTTQADAEGEPSGMRNR